MPTVRLRDINMYYEIQGKGDSLVVIPGFGGGTGAYFRTIPVLTRDYRVIAIDNRGSGLSDKPDIPYSMEMMADDVAGLLEALGITRAHVLGTSMGGMIAQHVALRHPEKTATLMLLGTTCGGKHSVPASQEFVRHTFLVEQTPEERARGQIPFFFSQGFIDSSPDVIDSIVSVLVKYSPVPYVVARQTGASFLHDTYDRLPDIGVPTLVIAGAEDEVIPVGNARILASRIPNAELVIMDGLRHVVHTEAPEELHSVIRDFLKRHPMKQVV
jgi:pimeloyl-ACP methyl ester carboxylesterase